jgi:hypothetical protein
MSFAAEARQVEGQFRLLNNNNNNNNNKRDTIESKQDLTIYAP